MPRATHGAVDELVDVALDLALLLEHPELVVVVGPVRRPVRSFAAEQIDHGKISVTFGNLLE
jgi:hypothetical protein